VGKIEGLGNAFQQPKSIREVQGGDVLREGLSLDILHATEGATVRESTRVMHGNYAGMLQAGQNARLPEKAHVEIVPRLCKIKHFNATRRFSTLSSASHTLPMPPEATNRTRL
jgi:hypothetical protein